MEYSGNNLNNAGKVREIFNNYSSFIFNIYMSKVNDQALAEELYQDLFIKLSGKQLPKKIPNMKGYLYKIIINSVYDRIRSIESQKKNLKKYQENYDFSIKDIPSASVYYNKGEILYEKGIRLLTQSEKTVFQLMFKDGKSIEEISDLTGLKRETISRYISISLKKIRDNINTEKENDDQV